MTEPEDHVEANRVEAMLPEIYDELRALAGSFLRGADATQTQRTTNRFCDATTDPNRKPNQALKHDESGDRNRLIGAEQIA